MTLFSIVEASIRGHDLSAAKGKTIAVLNVHAKPIVHLASQRPRMRVALKFPCPAATKMPRIVAPVRIYSTGTLIAPNKIFPTPNAKVVVIQGSNTTTLTNNTFKAS